MNEVAKREIKCPKCRTVNVVKAGPAGMFRCKSCNAGLRVGGGGPSDSERKLAKARDKGDEQTVKRAVIVVSVVAVLIAIVYLANRPDRPVEPTSKSTDDSSAFNPRTTIPATDDSSLRSPPSQQELVARKFLRALAAEDRATIDVVVDYRQHFAKVAQKNNWEENRKYENQTPDQQAVMRDEAASYWLSPDRCDHLKRYLVAGLDDDRNPASDKKLGVDYGSFSFDVKLESGKTAVVVQVNVGLRDGFTAGAGKDDPKAWGVYDLLDRWEITSVGRPKKDKDFKSAYADRKKEEVVAERVARRGGPHEEPAVELPPLPGTSTGQAAAIKDAIATLNSPTASASDTNRARLLIRETGKTSIPFLLNELVGKDHRDNEEHRRNSAAVVRELVELTGVEIPYGPMNSDQPSFGMVQMTPDERETSVRRWFGWWKTKGPTFEGKPVVPDPDDLVPPAPPPKPPKKN